MSNWKQEVLEKYHKNPQDIGRKLSREMDVPWATMWDFKQKLLNGEVVFGENIRKPRILLFDVETAPIIAHVWGLFKQNVSLNQIQQDWYMLSWSAKWLGEDLVYSDCLYNYPDFEEDPENDLRILETLYKMLDEADIVIGHNLKKFDIKKAKARFLKYGFDPLSSFQTVDTLDIAKQEFGLTSNRLDFLATFLDLPNKVSHEGHTLWTKCMAGDPEAWDKMLEYNEYDTVLLEDVYLRIRPWFRKHPNVALYYNDCKVRCTCCGSDDIEPTGGKTSTNLSQFTEYRCNNCGKVSRDGVNTLSKEKRQANLRNAL